MSGLVTGRTRCFHIKTEESLPDQAEQLISEFAEVFRDQLPLQPARVPPFEIQLIPGEALKRHRFVRPQGQHMQEEIRREVQKLIEAKCVIKGEASACSQVLLVKKPDESWRFCIDYRRLNSVTIPDSFPLPKIEDVMQKLEGKALYTVFDLLKGYYQIALHPNSQHLSAFITPDGVYKWVRIPMGVMNAPSYFQMKLRTEVLAGLEDSCIVYIDDVIIFGQTKKEHWTNVRKVLERFRQFNIVVSPKKCRWGLLQLQYLGILINSEGQWMSDERKRAFNDIPLPTTMTQLRSFLGVGNYFRKHIEKYAAITASLYQIVSKGKKTLVMWEPHTIEAFETLKKAILAAPMLYFLKAEGEIRLYTDASDIACGAHLTQRFGGEEHSVAFVSKTFNSSQKKWDTADKEMFGVVYAVKRLHYYLGDRIFTICTDHRNLQFETHLSQRVQRWKMALADYRYVIEYIKGETNVVADALSRCVESEFLEGTKERLSFSDYIQPASTQDIQDIREAEEVMVTRAFMARTQHSQSSQLSQREPHDELANDLTQQPSSSEDDEESLEEEEEMHTVADDMDFVIKKFHEGPGAHQPTRAVLEALKAAGYRWQRMAKEVDQYVNSCTHCQAFKDKVVFPHGGTYHVSSTRPMEEVAMDTLGPLPPDTNGFSYVLVMVDTFSRWTDLFPLRTTAAEEAAKAVLDFCTRYGTPERLTSDNGPQFVNEVIQELATNLHLRTITTIPGNHQENGLVENRIRFIRRLIAAFESVPSCYQVACMMVRRAINARRHRTLGMAPADIQFGQIHRLDKHLFPIETEESDKGWPSHYWRVVREQDKAIETTRTALASQQATNARTVDPIHSFKPGDWILVENDRATITKTGRRKREGPFRIQMVTPTGITYESPKFPGRRLTVAVGRVSRYSVRPGANPHQESLRDDPRYYVVEEILDHKKVGGRNIQAKPHKISNTQVKVKWVGHEETSWEPLTNRTIRRLDTFKHYAKKHPELQH
jgi:hypothetical protein